MLGVVGRVKRTPKLYPRPGQESKTGGIFHSTAPSDQILSPKFESLTAWESKMEPIFSCSEDRARKATRKCVAAGHSEERSRPHFDTSKSKITLLGMTSYPSLHSATKNYLQEGEFLLVAKPSCTQKGTPFLIALSFTILDHLLNQQKSQIFFLIPTASSKNPLKIHRITIRYTSDLSLSHSCSCKDFNTQSEAIVWRRDS